MEIREDGSEYTSSLMLRTTLRFVGLSFRRNHQRNNSFNSRRGLYVVCGVPLLAGLVVRHRHQFPSLLIELRCRETNAENNDVETTIERIYRARLRG